MLALACLVYRGVSSPRDLGALTDRLADYDHELAELQRMQEAVRPQLREQRLILAAGRSITDQPDWSLVLNYLADELLGENIVLSGCSLAPAQGAGEGDRIHHTPLTLTLSGYGRTTPDVSQFILRLEQTKLFDQVQLARSDREPFLQDQAIAFEAHCVILTGLEKNP